MANIYYDPEKFGLKVVAAIDIADSYEFCKFVVWKKEDGRLVYLTDSGCSCPTPFDDYGLGDVKDYSEDAFDAWLGENSYRSSSPIEVLEFKKKCRSASRE